MVFDDGVIALTHAVAFDSNYVVNATADATFAWSMLTGVDALPDDGTGVVNLGGAVRCDARDCLPVCTVCSDDDDAVTPTPSSPPTRSPTTPPPTAVATPPSRLEVLLPVLAVAISLISCAALVAARRRRRRRWARDAAAAPVCEGSDSGSVQLEVCERMVL